jgi:hypothetical protein
MEQNNKGRYCPHCSKSVVDFTHLTDTEIVEFFQQSSGKVCGRLTKQQLNRTLKGDNARSSSCLYQVLAWALFLGSTQGSVAKDSPVAAVEISAIESNHKSDVTRINEKAGDSLPNIVRGKTVDAQSKQVLSFTSVLIKHTKIAVISDSAGLFELNITDELMVKGITLIASSVGYNTAEINLDKHLVSKEKELFVLPLHQNDCQLTGEVVVVKRKKWWQLWK